jgi:phospholipid-transporting ATPase
VVCRTPEGKIMLYCKGADNIMIDRLAPGHLTLETLKSTLAHYGNEGTHSETFSV